MLRSVTGKPVWLEGSDSGETEKDEVCGSWTTEGLLVMVKNLIFMQWHEGATGGFLVGEGHRLTWVFP